MEFHEKLQELRRQKGLTQEELGEVLYVSRTAVSKWESGRGYPNIESLKAIAAFFSVSIDGLLSGEEVLHLAEEDTKERQRKLRDRVFGLLDGSAVLCLILPLFGQTAEGQVAAVSLLALTGTAPYLRMVYFSVVAAAILWGALQLTLAGENRAFWQRHKINGSVLLSGVGVLLFILGKQPYAAAFWLAVLFVKGFLLVKWP